MNTSNRALVSIIAADRDVRNRLRRQLDVLGCRIEAVAPAVSQPLTSNDADVGCVVLHLNELDADALQRLDALLGSRRTPIVLVVDAAPVPLVVQAMKKGVTDVLELASADGKLIAAVRDAIEVCANDHYECVRREAARRAIQRLTPREREVLRGLVSGRSSKEIAAELYISPRTVGAHRWNIRQRLQVGRLSELVRIAVLAGEA